MPTYRDVYLLGSGQVYPYDIDYTMDTNCNLVDKTINNIFSEEDETDSGVSDLMDDALKANCKNNTDEDALTEPYEKEWSGVTADFIEIDADTNLPSDEQMRKRGLLFGAGRKYRLDNALTGFTSFKLNRTTNPQRIEFKAGTQRNIDFELIINS